MHNHRWSCRRPAAVAFCLAASASASVSTPVATVGTLPLRFAMPDRPAQFQPMLDGFLKSL